MSNADIKSGLLEMLRGLRHAARVRFLDLSRRLLGQVAGEERYTDRVNHGRGRVPQRGRLAICWRLTTKTESLCSG